MLTNKKRHKLMLEILGIVGLCFGLTVILYLVITAIGRSYIDWYFLRHNITADEFAYYRMDRILYGAGLAISAVFFIVLFLVLFVEKIAYIRKITAGIHAMQQGRQDVRVEIKGTNELTELAEAVNFLSESQRALKETEARLSQERETLIRTLSHDIRTPLTSLISYTQLLSGKESLTVQEQQEYLALVRKKTAQIKELTDILLDGSQREAVCFEDARLLFQQLAEDFAEALENSHTVTVSLAPLPAFSGRYDVGQLQRIFDNLISNVQKYADPAKPVTLDISRTDAGLTLCQSNAIGKQPSPSESYRLGLSSIRRIMHNYGGTVDVSADENIFRITVTFPNL